MKILGIVTEEVNSEEILAPTSMLRVLNYIERKLLDLKKSIEIEFLDLRLENLPKFLPEDLDQYRTSLTRLLRSIFDRFPFEIILLSCYGSDCYLNTLVVANLIKSEIKKNLIIIVGGPHPTICPEDFQAENIPKRFLIQDGKTPFDYLIPGEGEIPLFELVSDLIDGKRDNQGNLNSECIILKEFYISNLDDLPIIDFKLFIKYKKQYITNKILYIDFSRGCQYNCYFCINNSRSRDAKKLRTKSIERIFKELLVIIQEEWENVHICDVIFLPNPILRRDFFKKLETFPYSLPMISISDRIDFCSNEDLKAYKRFNITPKFGLETVSPTLISRINKTLLSPSKYLKRFKELVLLSNKIGLISYFNFIINLPSTDQTCLDEIESFLSSPFIDRNFINLIFRIFYIVPKTNLYNEAEQTYGAKFTKDYWKVIDNNQKVYSHIVQPSKDLSLRNSLDAHLKIIKKFIKVQNKFEYSIYDSNTLFYLGIQAKRILDLKKNLF